jgi:ketosteroid isomerase-like protein
MTADTADVGRARVHQDNPFPGLRPFEPHESTLFFGREDQCDDLLTRLGRRRLVAVVGMSGSGKSSLVRAGLLPALDRGYLPSAGSSWHIAIFRPGSDPVANLTRGLAERRLPGGAAAGESPEDIRALLDASSLGLAAASRRLLQDTGDSLLVVADQFEELFRFGRIVKSDGASERAAACVDLLLNASLQEDIPVYVVLTMRSDYLGDCAHFTGLPEALNDSQFLVPRMTRAQLRDAIECPVAVGGARITPRLVQRLLHEIEEIPSGPNEPAAARRAQDELPVLQHALMRMWDVSRASRERGEPIDLPHYEQPPVETLRHALDRHAEEVYRGLPTDLHRDAARLVFQQLTDRDAENREVRRPTPLAELTAVAQRAAPGTAAHADGQVVGDVIAAFAAPGREFVVVNAQQDVDISHESFIRRWTRLHEWVERESRSRRIYTKLADVAADWERGHASLYRGPELADARRWWDEEAPTQTWANRYGAGFDTARRFLEKSVAGHRRARLLRFSYIASLLVLAAVIAVLLIVSRNQAIEAEKIAIEAKKVTDSLNATIAEVVLKQAQQVEQAKAESASELARLRQQVQFSQQPEADRRVEVAPGESNELERLRQEEQRWRQTEATLRKELAAALQPAPSSGTISGNSDLAAERTELARLRIAESTWERENSQLRQQLAKSQQAESMLRKGNEEMQARLEKTAASDVRPAPSARPDTSAIEKLLLDYEAAYESLDAAAVVRVMPSARGADLSKSFSQLRSYEMQIQDPQITVAGDTAVVTCVRRISIQPKVGSRPAARTIPTVFQLRRSEGRWTIEVVTEPK